MAVSLTKGGNVSLSKEAPGLKSVRRWAESIVRRAALFGIAEPMPLTRHG